MNKWRNKVKRVFKKTIETINKPGIRKTSKMASSVLNTIYLIKSKNPISVFIAGISVINSFAESFELPCSSKMDTFVKNNKLVSHRGSLPYLVASSKLLEKLTSTIVLDAEEVELLRFEIDSECIYFIQQKNKAVTYGEDGKRFERNFYTTAGFDFEKIFTVIWECYSDGVYLCRNKTTDRLEISALPIEDLVYIGPHKIKDFTDEMKSFQEQGHSRSYMFCGSPGAGKTTFALQIATKSFKRTLRIDPSVVKSLISGELEFFINQLCPHVILFDDFDRAYYRGEVGPVLTMLENIKRMFPQTVMIATVNDFDRLDSAIYRPGRFDEVLWFNNPNVNYRKEILKFYADKYAVEISEKCLIDLVQRTEGFTPVYLKELVIRISAYADTIEKNIQRAMKDFEKRFPTESDDSQQRATIRTPKQSNSLFKYKDIINDNLLELKALD